LAKRLAIAAELGLSWSAGLSAAPGDAALAALGDARVAKKRTRLGGTGDGRRGK